MPALVDVLSSQSSSHKKLGALRALDRMGSPANDVTTAVARLLGDEDVGPTASEFILHVGLPVGHAPPIGDFWKRKMQLCIQVLMLHFVLRPAKLS